MPRRDRRSQAGCSRIAGTRSMRGHNSLIGRHVESALPPPSGGGAAQRRCGPIDTTPRGETPRIQTVSKTPPTSTETKQKRSPEWGPPPSRRKDWFIQEYASRSPTDEKQRGRKESEHRQHPRSVFAFPVTHKSTLNFKAVCTTSPSLKKFRMTPQGSLGIGIGFQSGFMSACA